jgi:hypothetical protein
MRLFQFCLKGLSLLLLLLLELGFCSNRHHVNTGSGSHPDSYLVGTGNYFTGDTAARKWLRTSNPVMRYRILGA